MWNSNQHKLCSNGIQVKLVLQYNSYNKNAEKRSICVWYRSLYENYICQNRWYFLDQESLQSWGEYTRSLSSMPISNYRYINSSMHCICFLHYKSIAQYIILCVYPSHKTFNANLIQIFIFTSVLCLLVHLSVIVL